MKDEDDDVGPVSFMSFFKQSEQRPGVATLGKRQRGVAVSRMHREPTEASQPASKGDSRKQASPPNGKRQHARQGHVGPAKKHKADGHSLGGTHPVSVPVARSGSALASQKQLLGSTTAPQPRRDTPHPERAQPRSQRAGGSRQDASPDDGGQKRKKGKHWPFPTDYNDHFETSLQAVQDLVPVLQQLCQQLQKGRAALRIYDPFFCKGGIRRHYAALGFTTFIHENRDFYADVAAGTVPEHDVLVTNPPYSADHKERALSYVFGSGKPWALLLPNYVANKQYYSQLVEGLPPSHRPFYITPNARYDYEHPEGTGHEASPFYSIWYVGGFGAATQLVYDSCTKRLLQGAPAAGAGAGAAPAWTVTLARGVDQLRQAKAVPTAKRLNPKQRQRLKKQLQHGR